MLVASATALTNVAPWNQTYLLAKAFAKSGVAEDFFEASLDIGTRLGRKLDAGLAAATSNIAIHMGCIILKPASVQLATQATTKNASLRLAAGSWRRTARTMLR